MTYAGVYVGETPEAVRATLALLRYYRAFLRSGRAKCRHPEDRGTVPTMGREEAQSRLHYLIDVAINRKAGISDAPGRTPDYVWFRDQRKVHGIHRSSMRVYSFETRVVKERFGHLLSRHDD